MERALRTGGRAWWRRGRLAALALGGLTAAAGGTARAASLDGWERLDKPAKAFKVKDLDGRLLDSRALKGKVVVIDFWATWCTPCVQELPELEAYKKKIDGRKDLVLLSLNVTEDVETVRAFVQRRSIRSPIYLGDDLLGPYQVAAFPTKLILDLRGNGAGVVRFRREGGPVSMASLEERVEAVLAAKP